ncbi:MAG TPA: M48 family metallopeptidase [Bacteroidales bacterium]|jgi:heat shock protein HtpX|nr:M48 family metallopeptidase [Bacteroidales bacterium]
MKYVGLQGQIWKNNIKSVLLLILFPVVIIILVWLFFFFVTDQNTGRQFVATTDNFLKYIPWISLLIFLWFLIAYFSHTAIIKKATGSVSLERKENKRIYNMVENLSIANGMPMPSINLIEDDSLNAFASGINKSTYTISLSRGIINKLNDEELEAVIAHEMTHIRNRDVRLLIISIVFVGIFAFLTEALFRMIRFSGARGSGKGKKDGGYIVLVALALAAIGYLLSTLFRFALSKKREYLADSGSAEMTKKPLALASALEKISTDSRIEAVEQRDVAQLFIDNPREKRKMFSSIALLFSTHPPIEKRIELLRQY